MAKAYWVNTYRSISNPTAFEAYARLAPPAIQAGGGRFLVRGGPAKVYEAGMMQNVATSTSTVVRMPTCFALTPMSSMA